MKIGIDLGGSHIGLGVINSDNNILENYEKDFTEEEKKDILPVIENYIINMVNNIKNQYDIEEIGIAVPGVTKNGIILRTINLGINNYNISKKISENLHIPVKLRNDAKCACLAEYAHMVKEDSSLKDITMLFLTIGTGIGGGVIYNGKLLEGHMFEGYELGHIVIKENGIPCKCGKNGCFEKYGSILEYKKKVKQRLNIPENVNADPLREIMKARREEIADIDNQYISDLALGISNLINIFEPDTIVLGGGYSHFSYMFGNSLKDAIVNSNLLFNKRNDIDLRIAKLGNDAGIIGSIL